TTGTACFRARRTNIVNGCCGVPASGLAMDVQRALIVANWKAGALLPVLKPPPSAASPALGRRIQARCLPRNRGLRGSLHSREAAISARQRVGQGPVQAHRGSVPELCAYKRRWPATELPRVLGA